MRHVQTRTVIISQNRFRGEAYETCENHRSRFSRMWLPGTSTNNIEVDLFEMRPSKTTPAHHTGNLAELVCSNSFRSDALTNAAGL